MPICSLGEACVAHKITDADSGKRWYPPLIEQPPCADESLCTVSRPRLDYPEPVLYDMEASGFYEAATRFSTSELVQCIKVVSDNGESPASQINASQICAWIENRACLVDTLLQQLQALARPLQQHHPGLLAQCLGRWHFTAQQRLQLERLLSRWEVLAPDEPPTMQVLSDAKQAKDVLHRLRQQLDGLPITFT
jgi:adenosylhomocysteine nucleosidase